MEKCVSVCISGLQEKLVPWHICVRCDVLQRLRAAEERAAAGAVRAGGSRARACRGHQKQLRQKQSKDTYGCIHMDIYIYISIYYICIYIYSLR